MGDKRQFLTYSLAGVSAILAQQSWAKSREARPQLISPNSRMLRPPRLKKGDAIALINPGGVVSDEHIQSTVKNAESLGLKPRIGTNLRAKRGGYAGTPQQRADDVHSMWRNPEIRALWSVRGGSGTSQTLPLIDYAMLRANPKVLMGYSDMTALLNAVTHLSRMITFHTPSGISTLTDYSRNHLESILFEGAENYVMRSAAANDERAATDPEFRVRTLREGVATGALVGGNLAVFSALVGTPYLPTFANKLLFLEDINEAPYRIDRMLTQLRQHSANAKPAATIFGVFRKCEATDGEPSITLAEAFADHASDHAVPTVSGYSVGHIAHQMVMPIGAVATLNTDAQTLTLHAASVR